MTRTLPLDSSTPMRRLVVLVVTVRPLAPTATRGARLKARCAFGSVTIPYPYEGTWSQHCNAASTVLLDKLLLRPHYTLIARGDLPTGSDSVLIYNYTPKTR